MGWIQWESRKREESDHFPLLFSSCLDSLALLENSSVRALCGLSCSLCLSVKCSSKAPTFLNSVQPLLFFRLHTELSRKTHQQVVFSIYLWLSGELRPPPAPSPHSWWHRIREEHWGLCSNVFLEPTQCAAKTAESGDPDPSSIGSWLY